MVEQKGRGDWAPGQFERRVFVLGAGRVGRALIEEMVDSGVPVVGAWNRSPETAQATEQRTGVAATFGRLPDTREAQVVLLAVPDRRIAPVVERLLNKGLIYPTQILLHCSGALPSTVLRMDNARPASVGCLHPLQSFPASHSPARSYFVSVEGESLALQTALALARHLGHPTLPVHAQRKALYHAGATVAANYLVTLQSAAADLLARAGVPYQMALRALAQICHATIEHVADYGPAAALTGPIVRGDWQVVERHLEVLDAEAPDLVELYRVMGRYTLALTAGAGEVVPQFERMRELFLGESPPSLPDDETTGEVPKDDQE